MSNLLVKRHYWIIINYPYKEKARIFVYKEQINNTLYFSANDIAYCLEFNIPHNAIKTFIPKKSLSYLPFTNGIFLNIEAVSNFITDTLISIPNDFNDEINQKNQQRIKQFEKWFNNYLSKCANENSGRLCPK